MKSQTDTQAFVVGRGGSIKPNQVVERIVLFHEDGSAVGITNQLVTTGTAIGTAAKTTTSPEPPANSIVPIKFTNGNSAASPTVAFNGGTARAIQIGGAASPAAKIVVAAGGVAVFWFDGTVLHQMGALT